MDKERGYERTPFSLIAALAAFSLPASAQTPCDNYDDLVETLASRYDEHSIAAGLSTTGHLVETFATADGSTWTIVFTDPAGKACLMAAGINWEALASAKPMSAPL